LLARFAHSGGLDRLAIGLSGLCLAHCVASVVILSLLASAGGMLVHPIVHQIGLALAIAVAAVSLWCGIKAHGLVLPSMVVGIGVMLMTAALFVPHGFAESVCTMAGVAILALGHSLNRRAVTA
jgi:hypothetical protein